MNLTIGKKIMDNKIEKKEETIETIEIVHVKMIEGQEEILDSKFVIIAIRKVILREIANNV